MKAEADLLALLPRPKRWEEDALEILGGPEDGKLFPLKPDSTAIGRLESADVPLCLDASVSRNHAHITQRAGRYFIEDLGSTHGTVVNDNRVEGETEVHFGDHILLGSTLLALRQKETS